jgi:hypothetical protein
MLLLLRNNHTFHENRPRGICTISEIVSHVVLTAINSGGHFKSVSSYDINVQWRLIQDNDIVVRPGNSKKKYARSDGHEKQQIHGCLYDV